MRLSFVSASLLLFAKADVAARLQQLAPAALANALSADTWRGGGANMAALLAAGGPIGVLQGACACASVAKMRTHHAPSHLTPRAALLLLLFAVYLDDMHTPVLTVPLAPAAFLLPRTAAANASCWMGITASTGEFFQAVDILSWNASGAATP
jgi:hypothetical protein